MKKKEIGCLILCVSLFLAGCGAGGSGDGQSSTSNDPISRYMESRETEDSGAGNGAGSSENGGAGNGAGGSESSASGGSGDELPDIMENPAYSAMGRQVVTAVVTVPFRETMDRITAFNESSPDYFIEMKSYGGGAKSFEVLETQLPLEVLSGKGP